jgi:putative nucleotidyltransferase with HDIG domain
MLNYRIRHIEQHVQTVVASVVAPDLKLAHDFKHVDRVRGWALQIAQSEGFPDLELVEAAALLHDIGLVYVERRSQHAHVGAEIAAGFLQENNLFTAPEITAIAEAIRCHSSLSGGGQLGEILRDADILDLFGAVGLMRAFTSKYAKPEYDPHNVKGETWGMTSDDFTHRFASGLGIGGYIVDQINFQLSCYENLRTETAKRIAKPFVVFIKTYLLQLESEIRASSKRPRI